MERVVQVAPHDEIARRAWECIGPREDLDVASIESDGEVVVEAAFGLETEDLFKLTRLLQRSMDIGKAFAGEGKASVVLLNV